MKKINGNRKLIFLKQTIKGEIREKGGWPTFLKAARFLLSHFFLLTNQLRYFFKKTFCGAFVKEINGVKMFLDLKDDSGISKELYLYSKREIHSTDYVLSSGVLKDGDVVLDIGANIGYYALLESRLVGERGIVYALEPVRRNLDTLKKNIRLNGFENIETHRIAAGEKRGTSTIYVHKKGNWSSMTYGTGGGFVDKETIEITTIDDFLQNKKAPQLIRMDVEGYEYQIIKGMKKTLELSRLNLLIEFHADILSNEQIHEIFTMFEEKGFRKAIVIIDPYLVWINPRGYIRPIIKRFTKMIGDVEKIGSSKMASTGELLSFLMKNRGTIHALLYK